MVVGGHSVRVSPLTLCLAVSVGFTSGWTVAAADYPTLRQVNVILRHGARSPTNPFPTDQYKDVWPQGYGQLTTVGMMQAAESGEFLRTYYQRFLNGTYIADEIYTRSSDWDRTLMAGESFLSGLYPPKGDQVWNPAVPWQPVPVHTIYNLNDIVLDMDNPVCPEYSRLKYEATQTEEFKKANATHEEFYQYLKNHTGQTEDMDPFATWDVYDTLLAEQAQNLTLPSWATDEVMTIIPDFFIPWQFEINFGGPEKGRLKGGPLMRELVQNMYSSVNGSLTPPERKLFFYSGHDNNLVTTMQLTKTYNERYVPYASMLFLELHQVSQSDFAVRMLYRNSSTQLEPHLINITVCGGKTLCPFEEFVDAVKEYFITHEEWLEECKLKPPPEHLTAVAYFGIAVAVALVLVLLIGGAVVCKRRSKSRQITENTPLSEDESYRSY